MRAAPSMRGRKLRPPQADGFRASRVIVSSSMIGSDQVQVAAEQVIEPICSSPGIAWLADVSMIDGRGWHPKVEMKAVWVQSEKSFVYGICQRRFGNRVNQPI
jgi:hypothetical protein